MKDYSQLNLQLYISLPTLVFQFSRTADVRKQKVNEEETFFILYSQETLKIRRCEGSLLNLMIKINLPPGIEAEIGLLLTFITKILPLENFKCLSNKAKQEFITLDLLNRNFCNTVTIGKNQELAYMILINDNEEDKIITKHKQVRYIFIFVSEILFYEVFIL